MELVYLILHHFGRGYGTDGVQFTTPGAGGSAVAEIRKAIERKEHFRAVGFEFLRAQNDIDHP